MKSYGIQLANIEPGKPWQNGSKKLGLRGSVWVDIGISG